LRQKLLRAIRIGVVTSSDSLPEVLDVPVDDDGSKQVWHGHTAVLAFDGPITDFAMTANAQSFFQSAMGLTLVETNLNAARSQSTLPAPRPGPACPCRASGS
jgi:hypothetical protein